MAYRLDNLTALSFSNGFTLWRYKAIGDQLEALEAPGFFDKARGDVREGDIVIVSARDANDFHVATAQFCCTANRSDCFHDAQGYRQVDHPLEMTKLGPWACSPHAEVEAEAEAA